MNGMSLNTRVTVRFTQDANVDLNTTAVKADVEKMERGA